MSGPGQPSQQPLKGYNLLANMMAEYADLAIFRLYMPAHYFDLMLQQAELSHLLQELGGIKLEDIENPDVDIRQFDTHFLRLIESSKNGKLTHQWGKQMMVRLKLKEYADHLLQVHALLNLPTRNANDLKALREWLVDQEGGKKFVHGAERQVWDESTQNDLTSLNGHGHDQDALTRLFEAHILRWLNEHGLNKLKDDRRTLHDPFLDATATTRLDIYSDRAIAHSFAVLSTILSSLLPAMSIFALYYVRRQLLRLGLILVFNVLFSAIVMFVTPAKRAECFAASAAFAAVQVVFVSTSPGPTTNATLSKALEIQAKV